MARPKLSGSLLARKDASAPATAASSLEQSTAGEGRGDKPIALTVKVDQARYEALKVLGARTRRSNQEILLAALDAYLHATQEPQKRSAPDAEKSDSR
jgi:hypothetical protein